MPKFGGAGVGLQSPLVKTCIAGGYFAPRPDWSSEG